MASMEKMPSGNADTAFVRNCDLDSNYMARIQRIQCVVFQCINIVLFSIPAVQRIYYLWYYGKNAAMDIKISKRLLKDRIIATSYM